jgi:hypothetical protein
LKSPECYNIVFKIKQTINSLAVSSPFPLNEIFSVYACIENVCSAVSALLLLVLFISRKDDEELKVGSSLARLAVPHPVLQEPKSVQIMYTAYSGWISSGLANWSIDKVTLTDSFGKR